MSSTRLRDKRVEAELSSEVGLRVLHRSDELTVLNVVAPRRRDYALPRRPHDHRMWAVIGIIEGQEDNEFFRRSDDTIVPSGGRRVDSGEVLVLGRDVIHSVGNLSVLVCGGPRHGLTAAGEIRDGS